MGRSQEKEQKGPGRSRRKRGATRQGRRLALVRPGTCLLRPQRQSVADHGEVALCGWGNPHRAASANGTATPQENKSYREGAVSNAGQGPPCGRVSTCQGVSAGMLSQRPPLALGCECKRLLRDGGSDTGKERTSTQMALMNRMLLGTVRWDRTCQQLSHPGTLPTTSCVSLLKTTPGGSHPLAVPTCLAHLSRVTR